MTRRDLLRCGALAGAALSGCAPIARPAAPDSPARASVPKTVVVIGAGLAGLVAGHELLQAGHDVTIVEAQSRAGGRVRTLREPFADGLYTEAGALFIPDSHDLTLAYVRLFDLSLDRVAPRATGKFYYVRGRRLTLTRGARVNWPFELTPEEASLGLSGIWQKYIGTPLRALGDPTAPGWVSNPALDQLDRMNGAEFLRAQGASPGAIALLRLGYFDLSGEGLESHSALFVLRDLALRQREKQTFTIRGGNELLPGAFAQRLAGRILYHAPAVRIEPGEHSTRVVIRRPGGHQTLKADRVVCAVPFSVLRRIEVAPAFSPPKRAAIEGLSYTSVTRVFVQSRRRFWDDQDLPRSATTDLPIKWVWDSTANQPGPRGILESYTAGTAARQIASMTERDRIGFVLEELQRVYPGIREQFEAGVSKCWDEDPWARGGYAWFKPGQLTSLLPHIVRPEGRVHFAGEHTSGWPQWMQGALESGIRAAREINDA